MIASEYESMSTVDLRSLVRKRGMCRGWTFRGIKKPDLVDLLTGETTEEDLQSRLAANGDSTTGASGTDLADAIAQAIQGRVHSGTDEAEVEAIVDRMLTDFAENALPGMLAQTSSGITIRMPELPEPVSLEGEATHFQLTQILAWTRANVPVWAWGAPGAGKTHLARQIARALDIPCFVMSIDETTTANKLLGFQNLVSGDYVKGWLYEPYKNGGLVCIDEIDTGNPGILAGLNALLANEHYMFPNGETVERHKNFRVLACANTNGTGAVAGYTARQRLDAATLNRFAVIRLEYDEGLETLLACGTGKPAEPWRPGKAADKDQCASWVKWVQTVRAHVGSSVLVSPRASLLGVNALRAGIPADQVAASLVYALCAEDTVTRIESNCGTPLSAVGA